MVTWPTNVARERDKHVTVELKAEEKLVVLVQLDSSSSFICYKQKE